MKELPDGERLMGRIAAQVDLGPRYPGTDGHAAAHRLLREWLAPADAVREHIFDEAFFGVRCACRNLWARFEGERPGRVLLGTHYDTRPWADCDPDPAKRRDPVPGANDGASGVALLAELAPQLAEDRARPTVDVLWLDAEDWHGIDGKEVSLGARRFVADLDPDDAPDRVLIVDMVAGPELMLDLDLHPEHHEPSAEWAIQVHRAGRQLGLPAFMLNKEGANKWVTDDHLPFMAAGIPSALLIDLDYPPWHTTRDLPEACDPAGMQQVAAVIQYLVWG